MMPGTYVPRNFFPAGYLALEISGFGGEGKDFLRPEAATEWAQTLMDCNFFSDNPSSPPVVTATATPDFGDKPLTVIFEATVQDPVGNITYSWDFADGNTGSGQSVEHTYDCNGTFNAQVRAQSDVGGCPGQDTVLVNVTKPAVAPIEYVCDVQPHFDDHCTACHGVGAFGGLDMRTCDSLAQGGNSGPAVIPGNRNASSVYTTIIDGSMPPGGEPPPTAEDTEDIGAWIDSLDPSDPNFCD
jgi:PKD repeat protein